MGQKSIFFSKFLKIDGESRETSRASSGHHRASSSSSRAKLKPMGATNCPQWPRDSTGPEDPRGVVLSGRQKGSAGDLAKFWSMSLQQMSGAKGAWTNKKKSGCRRHTVRLANIICPYTLHKCRPTCPYMEIFLPTPHGFDRDPTHLIDR